MGTTVGQETNCPKICFLVLFLRRKKISIFIGKYDFIMLMKRNKEPHFGSLPETENLRKKHGACSLITTTTAIKSFETPCLKRQHPFYSALTL